MHILDLIFMIGQYHYLIIILIYQQIRHNQEVEPKVEPPEYQK